jgi:hypothetical protein
MVTIVNVSTELLPILDLCLKNFRLHYPKNHLVVVGDGIVGDYPFVANKYKAEWISGACLKRTYRYPLWTDRIFQIAQERKSEYYLLIDPDTKIWREFTIFPDADYFGQIVPSLNGAIPTVNSCAAIFTRCLVERYFDVSRDVWDDLPREYHEYMVAAQAYKHDQWMPFILKRLNGKIAETKEVHAVFNNSIPENKDTFYAATHAHKTIKSWQ